MNTETIRLSDRVELQSNGEEAADRTHSSGAVIVKVVATCEDVRLFGLKHGCDYYLDDADLDGTVEVLATDGEA